MISTRQATHITACAYYNIAGSQNTYKHDLGRKWTQDMTSDVTSRAPDERRGYSACGLGLTKSCMPVDFEAPMHCETLCMSSHATIRAVLTGWGARSADVRFALRALICSRRGAEAAPVRRCTVRLWLATHITQNTGRIR